MTEAKGDEECVQGKLVALNMVRFALLVIFSVSTIQLPFVVGKTSPRCAFSTAQFWSQFLSGHCSQHLPRHTLRILNFEKISRKAVVVASHRFRGCLMLALVPGMADPYLLQPITLDGPSQLWSFDAIQAD